jgi:hypothetical protein
MPYGRKKLKALFNEKGIPHALRDLLPLLARGQQVLWVPGVAKAMSVDTHGPSGAGIEAYGQAVCEKHLEITCRIR